MSSLPHGRIVVVGGGMVAHRFAEHLCQRSPEGDWTLTVIGDEPHAPYDRVHLSEFFAGRTPDDLVLDAGPWSDPMTESGMRSTSE